MMKLFVLLILVVFASEKMENGAENGVKNEERFGNNENNSIVVKIEEDEFVNAKKKSKYIGVSYSNVKSKWSVQRWSRHENKLIHNGHYGDEETAALASDTLARKLMEKGEQKLKLNFPDDNTEVYPEKGYSKFIGVSYNKEKSKWYVQRWSKHENTNVSNGCYDGEETAAHASDTLARKLMKNVEQNLKLNFPDDQTEVYPEKKKTSTYIGVCYNGTNSKWRAYRRSRYENAMNYNGHYGDEESAAHASDTLAKQLMGNGEQGHKLNFPEDHTEVYPEKNQKKKRKRTKGLSLEHPQNN